MIRSVLAVLGGVVAWMVVATVADLLVRALLPGYTAAEPTMSFTLAMMVARLGVGIVSSLAAGFACSAIAHGNGVAVYSCAALLVLFFLPVHYNLWHKFPLWYHVFFLFTLAPLVILGAALQRRGHGSPATPRT